jgi:SAM-dependent methyltransferase
VTLGRYPDDVPKQLESTYHDELDLQRQAWERKPALRAVYTTWYQRIVDQLSPVGQTVELGSGAGNFKAFYPEAIASDVMNVGDWLGCVADAQQLPFADESVGNLVLNDVLHHLPRPLEFLRGATRVLKPGGRIILLEPAATPWGRTVLRFFHHEPVDLSEDVLGADGTPPPPNEDFMFANQAFGTKLFDHHPEETMKRLPGLEIASIDRTDFVVYPATGGFSYFCLVPARLAQPLQRLESRLLRRTGKVTAMRLLIVLEKRSGSAD